MRAFAAILDPAKVAWLVARSWDDMRIAQHYGFLDRRTIRNFRERHGIPDRPKPPPPDFDAKVVARLVRERKSDAEIAEHYGTTKFYVTTYRYSESILRGAKFTPWGGAPVEMPPETDMTGTQWRRGALPEAKVAELYGGRRYAGRAAA